MTDLMKPLPPKVLERLELFSRPIYWILVNREPVPVRTIEEWSLGSKDIEYRRVARTTVSLLGCIGVSTVFLGIDHNHGLGGPPLLFETMIFGGKLGNAGYCSRTSTWKQAEIEHRLAVRRARLSLWLGWVPLIGRKFSSWD